MLKNITLSVDEAVIQEARRRAAVQNTTLNALVREWLEQYIAREGAVAEYKALMERLAHVDAGRKFTREEMNERR